MISRALGPFMLRDEDGIYGLRLTFRHDETEEEVSIIVPPDWEEGGASDMGGPWQLVNPPGLPGYTDTYLRLLREEGSG